MRALVDITATGSVWISDIATWTTAQEAAFGVVAQGVLSTDFLGTFVVIVAADSSVSGVAGQTGTRVTAFGIGAVRLVAARVRLLTLVHVLALFETVADKAGAAIADVARRHVAAFGIADTLGRQIGFTFVDVFALESISFVTGQTATVEAAERIGAVSEHVTRPIFALVVIRSFAGTSSEAVVAMALVVEANSILTRRITYAGTLELLGQLVRTVVTLSATVAQFG